MASACKRKAKGLKPTFHIPIGAFGPTGVKLSQKRKILGGFIMALSRQYLLASAISIGLIGLTACSQEPTDSIDRSDSEAGSVKEEAISNAQIAPAERSAYFGDLHVHTGYSFDAYAFGTLATPDDAYRFARGEAIKHPGGYDVKLGRPLDFYGVTDHAIYLGVMKEAADPTTEISKARVAQPLHNINAPENMGAETTVDRMSAFAGFLSGIGQAIASGEIPQAEVDRVMHSAWADTIATANEHYDPGTFTTFVGYEFTTNRNQGSLHRNVIFRSAEDLPTFPFSRIDSQNPEDLWTWMDEQREEGVEILAIPHNSNGSGGQTFQMTDWNGKPIDEAYSQKRMRNEPLVEITQVKGTSDTHPALSTNDEWADFEIMAFAGPTLNFSEPKGGYVRDAFKRGLLLEGAGNGNPYKMGVIGSSDTHTGAGSYSEEWYFSKVGVLDSNGYLRGSLPMPEPYASALVAMGEGAYYKDEKGRIFVDGKYPTWGASGLAGVWAEKNTRQAIYDAMRRKETFATTGTRMRVRFLQVRRLTQALT